MAEVLKIPYRPYRQAMPIQRAKKSARSADVHKEQCKGYECETDLNGLYNILIILQDFTADYTCFKADRFDKAKQ